jgi:hypothetical protein
MRVTRVPSGFGCHTLKCNVLSAETLDTRMQETPLPTLGGRIRLRVFGITKAGLIAITLAVATLWACIGVEAATRRRADLEARASLQKLWKLRQNSVPVSAPVQPFVPSRPITS